MGLVKDVMLYVSEMGLIKDVVDYATVVL